ncbi:MAG TPA: hypothetical protein VFT74_09540, partial [Isosphaeraceae bacterium]|nr:hypothetical protein [Isosphaeraceae bacterium]
RAFVDRSLRSAIACGVVSGIGFLARPEVALVPVALSAAFGWRWIRETIAPLRNSTWESRRGGNVSLLSGKELRSSRQGAHAPRSPGLRHRPAWAPGHVSLAGAWIGLGLIVGYYALIKGEVSEKLAVRHSASVSTPSVAIPSRGHVLMPGMNAGEWDFSAKEESGNPSRLPPGRALGLFLCSWAESLGWIGAVLAILGAVRVRSGPGRTLVACYLGLFGVILVRHASMLGYLSGRHVLSLALLCTPWAASGLRAVGLRLSGWMNLELKRARRLRIGFALAAVVFASMIQLRPAHASRWGYQEAGLWISRHAGAGEAVLDTRGWAAFVADQPSYDYWHVRQALTDSRLTYIVVD